MVRSSLLRDLANTLDKRGKLKWGSVSKSISPKLEALPLPTWLRGFMGMSWYQASGDLPQFYAWSVEKILEYRHLNRFIDAKLLPIASCGNGDIVCVRFDEHEGRAVGIVSLEELHTAERIESVWFRIADTLEEFLYRIVEERYLAGDSFIARELLDLKAEMHLSALPALPTLTRDK